MFRLRLHPTPSGFAVGIAVIALWALLWLWFIAQLVERPGRTASRSAGSLPELTMRAARPDPAA